MSNPAGVQRFEATPADFRPNWSGQIYIVRQGFFVGYQMSLAFAGLLAPADGIAICDNIPDWTIGSTDLMTGASALIFDDSGQRADVTAFPLLHGMLQPITLDVMAPAALPNPTFDISACFPARTPI